MNALSHIYLSLIFKRAVEKELPVKLHTLSFIKGNLKPDFSPLLLKVPHYKIPSSEFIKNEIDKLFKHIPNQYTASTREFSERLGVVTHYLSDFFCFAHSVRFTGSVLDHYLYERRLSRFRKAVKDRIQDRIREMSSQSFHPGRSMDYQSLCSLIDRLHEKYSTGKPSYARDLIFTLRAGIPLAISLVSTCLQPEEAQAAA